MNELFTVIFTNLTRQEDHNEKLISVLENINKNRVYQEIENYKIFYNITLKDHEIVSLLILKNYLFYNDVGSVSMNFLINVENFILTRKYIVSEDHKIYSGYMDKYRGVFFIYDPYNYGDDAYFEFDSNYDGYIISFERNLITYYNDDIKEVMKYLNLINNVLGMKWTIFYTKCDKKNPKNKIKIHNLFKFNSQEIINYYDVNDFILKFNVLYYECGLSFELIEIIFDYVN